MEKPEKRMRPWASIVIPTYNGERTMRRCLEALHALSAGSPPHEIIAADNGSSDRTVAIIREFPDVVLVEERETRGASAARNAGARNARGEILAFTDQDCIVSPQWLCAVRHAFRDPGVIAAGGAIQGVPPQNDVQRWMNSRKILDQEWALTKGLRPYMQTANAFFRRRDFAEVGGFDADIPFGGDDCDFSWRLQEATGGRLVYVPDALVLHDHRCSLKGLFRQGMKNAQGGAYLRMKWGSKLPRKRLSTSLWECCDLARSIGRYVMCPGRDERYMAGLDVLHRIGRKWGMIAAAWKTGQWAQW